VPGLLGSGGISRTSATGQTRLIAGLNKLEGAFALGVTADYSSLDGVGARALVSVSVGRDERNGGWHPQARPLAGSGAVSARAFLDANGNGLMDSNETAIPNVGILINGATHRGRTNDVGEAFLANLAPYQDVDLALATSTLEDPFWKPARDGVRILPRPGRAAIVDFPVLVTGEITGTVYSRINGKLQASSGVELELMDHTGVAIKKVRSAYDGFYDITEIRPGDYTLRMTAEQSARLGATAQPREAKMQPSGTVLDGADFILEPAPPTNPTASSPDP
jgi:hypothetical protein